MISFWKDSLQGFNAGPQSSGVGVVVSSTVAVVGHMNVLDRHGERTIIIIRLTTGPSNGASCVVWVTTGPRTNVDTAGSLRVAVSVVGLSGSQRADMFSVNVPVQAFLLPVDSVVVVVVDRASRDSEVALPSVVVDTLAKKVCLHRGTVAAEEFEIDLVEIIRQQHDRGNDSCARGGLQPELNTTAKDVKVGANGRRVALFVNGKVGGRAGPVDSAGRDGPEFIILIFCRVEDKVVCGAEGLVYRTDICSVDDGVAFGACLGEHILY